MFVQIHMLQSMPPGNLNRDDTGQPKKCLFGGVTRGRISSQCLKRNIRTSSYFEDAFGTELAKRTKYLPQLVIEALDSKKVPQEEFEGIKAGIAAQFKKEAKAEAGGGDDGASAEPAAAVETVGQTPQLVFFNPLFAQKIAELLTKLRADDRKAYDKFIGLKGKRSKEEDKNADAVIADFRQKALNARESLSIDVGLFGRMTTSDLIVDVEAACQVAHAISTHETLIESDYFTAMDDLKERFATSQSQSGGAAFLGSGDTETFFSSAVYYKYLNIDTDALLKNVRGQDPKQVQHAVGVMVQAAALATPTGKQNSFAAHSSPDLILVEVSKTRQPVSYANAFLAPVEGKNLMRESVAALSAYCSSVASAFAPPDTKRFILAVGPANGVKFGLPATTVVHTLPELMKAVEAAAAPSPVSVGAK